MNLLGHREAIVLPCMNPVQTIRVTRENRARMKESMNWINLTPHEIKILGGESPVLLPASGQVARVSRTLRESGTVDGIRTVKSVFGAVSGLPAEDIVCGYCGCTDCEMLSGVESICNGTTGPRRYVVSTMVRLAVPHRRDVWSPADEVRDEKGNVLGYKALERN